MRTNIPLIILCCIPGLLGILNASLYCLFDYSPRNVYRTIARHSHRIGLVFLFIGIVFGLATTWEKELLYYQKIAFIFLVTLPLFIKNKAEKNMLPFKGVLLFMSSFLIYTLLSYRSLHQKELFLDSTALECATLSGLTALLIHNVAIIFKKPFSEQLDSALGLSSSIFIIISGALFCYGSFVIHPLEYNSATSFVTSIFKPVLISFFVVVEVLFVLYELTKSRKFFCSIENFCFSLTLLLLFGTLFFVPRTIDITS